MAKGNEWWLATDEDGSKHLFPCRPTENTNLFGARFWYAEGRIDVNNISQFLPRQGIGDEPRRVDIKITWKPQGNS